ncbi:MAG TPA: Uma2 family endonuclease [Thermoguttaceae bacterium]|nr:Uma2 family endonuclease [Thermoguttaceae bacterium]
MSSVAHFSLAQYELMVESGAFDGPHHQRIEFIRGEIREMTPIGIRHGAVVDRVTRLSTQLLPPHRAVVRIQGTLRAPALESAPEPDVLWLVPKDYFQGHPEPEDVLLLIEVAESSLTYDTGEKARLYAEAGIADYWVVDLVEDCVEVFRDPQPSGYRSRRTHRGDEEIRPLAFPDVALQPSALFRPS